MTAKKLVKKPRCIVCSHVERSRIEFDRMRGVSLDSLAAKYKITRDAIWRHTSKHVSDDQKAIYLADIPLEDLASRANQENLSLLDYLVISRATLMNQMQSAAACNDRHGTSSLAGRLNETLSLIGKLTGEMLALSPVNITNNTAIFMSSPLYLELEQMLIATLSDHPEVMAKVVNGLRQLEERTPTLSPPSAMKDVTPHVGP